MDLIGKYQIDNAAVAIQTAQLVTKYFKRSLTAAMIDSALETVTWPVRFEKVATNPEVVLDGAHNEPGVRALVETLRTRFSHRRVHVLFGALSDKNYPKMLQLLTELPNVVLHVVGFQGPNNRQPINPSEVLEQTAMADLMMHKNWQQGYQTVRAGIQPDDLILFTGSLYFVSEVRQAFATANENVGGH